MTSRVEELQRMCDNINENGGLDSGEWHTALLAQIAQNLAVIADVMMADRKTEPTISKMEQVDKDINVRSKTENCSEKPNNCEDLQDWKDRMWAEAIVTEPQYDFGEYADRLWKIAYERGKREALEQTEPSCDTCKLKDTTEWCKRQEVCRAYQPKDEPQTDEDCDYCKMTHKHWYEHCDICKRKPKYEPQTETSTNSEKVQLKGQLTDEPQMDCPWK